MNPTFRLATANIYRDRSRWLERRTLLVRELASLSLDLIALQEVTEPLGVSTAHWLADELGGYSVCVCPKTGWEGKLEGIAVLSRFPIECHEPLALGSQRRTAQLVRVRVAGQIVTLVNGHYYWPVGAHAAQVKQVGRVLDRIDRLEPGPVIICGDFNATPRGRAIRLIRQTFASAYQSSHGHEPDFTCPTPLISGGRVRRAITSSVCRTLSIKPSDLWRGTLDYIFVSPQIHVVDCDLILDQPLADDPTLYASDHFGLAATLEITG